MSRQPKLDRAISPGSAVKLHQLRSFTESFAFGDFTDGGGTTGTKTMTNKLPKGSLFHHAIVKVPVGWANDSSATIQIGDGSDVDAFSTGTPSVFTAAATGIAIGKPSATDLHNEAEVTVTITVTGGSDFTSINAGTLIVTMMYFGGPPDG